MTVITPSAEFRRAHEHQASLCDEADRTVMDEEWSSPAPLLVTESELDDMAAKIAETGFFDDELGQQKKASKLLQACAIDYMDDPMRLPGYVFNAFVDELTAITKLAKYGKR